MSVLLLSVLVSAAGSLLALADYFLLVDPLSGYVTVGSVFLRYGALALALLCFVLLMLRLPKKGGAFAIPTAMYYSFYLATALFAAGGIFSVLTARTLARYLLAGLYLLSAVWFAGVGKAVKKNKCPPYAVLGCAASIAMLAACMLRYLERPASSQHLLLTTGLLASIVALLFVTALLRGVYLPNSGNGRALFLFGSLAFFMGSCLMTVKYVFLALHGALEVTALLYDLPLFALGLIGLWTVSITAQE